MENLLMYINMCFLRIHRALLIPTYPVHSPIGNPVRCFELNIMASSCKFIEV